MPMVHRPNKKDRETYDIAKFWQKQRKKNKMQYFIQNNQIPE